MFSSSSSKKFDIYPLNDEISQEIPADKEKVEGVLSPDFSFEEPDTVALPWSFSENDYMRLFSLVKKMLVHHIHSFLNYHSY